MNWQREAIDKLKNYEAHQKALETIPKEIRRLEIGYTSIRSAATDSTPVSGGGEHQGGCHVVQYHPPG